MRPFPPASELSFLKGCELSNVTLQPYSADFAFVEGHLLVVEHGLEYIDCDGRKFVHDPQRRLGPDPVYFHALIGERIGRIVVDVHRLSLAFPRGRMLTILSKDGPYESGHLNTGSYDEHGVLRGIGLIVF